MSAYTGFAEVYDSLMDNVPYEEWATYLIHLLKENRVSKGTICDLACGTGSITEKLYDAGFAMIGIDLSVEMLSIAARKKGDRDILYLHQDMREFELFGKVSAFVCICDGINYLLEKEDIQKVFQLVHTYLEREGVFIFDLNTLYKYRHILGENTFAENREDVAFIWDNYFDEEEKMNEYALTLYVKEKKETKEELYRRFDELHYQKAYEIEEIKKLLEDSGLKEIKIFEAFSKEAPTEESERVYFVAKKK